MQLPDWAAGVGSRNVMVYDRLLRSANSEHPKAFWAKTLEEVNGGWVPHPQLIAPDVLKNIPHTPGFRALGNHGPGIKRRLIDDYKMSGVNDTVRLDGASVPASPNAAYVMTRTYGLSGKHLTPLLTLVEFAHSHKHVGIDGN